MNNILTAMLQSALKVMNLKTAIFLVDFKLSTIEVNESHLDEYVDSMKVLSLIHSLLGDVSNYDTFNPDKIELLRDPKIAKVGLIRFQERRKSDLIKLEPTLESTYESFISQLEG